MIWRKAISIPLTATTVLVSRKLDLKKFEGRASRTLSCSMIRRLAFSSYHEADNTNNRSIHFRYPRDSCYFHLKLYWEKCVDSAYTVIGENTVVGNNTKIGSGCAVGNTSTNWRRLPALSECCLFIISVFLKNRVVLHSGQSLARMDLVLHQSRMVHTKRFPSWATLSLRTMWRLELTRPSTVRWWVIHISTEVWRLTTCSNCTQCYCRWTYCHRVAKLVCSGSTKIGKHCMIGGQVWFCRSYWK